MLNLLQTKKVCQYDGMNFAIGVGEKKNNNIHAVSVISYNRHLEEGATYQLKEYAPNSMFGSYRDYYQDISETDYNTTSTIMGELKITYYDLDHAIISGTYWFDAINSKGEKVEVREGRFDMHYE